MQLAPVHFAALLVGDLAVLLVDLAYVGEELLLALSGQRVDRNLLITALERAGAPREWPPRRRDTPHRFQLTLPLLHFLPQVGHLGLLVLELAAQAEDANVSSEEVLDGIGLRFARAHRTLKLVELLICFDALQFGLLYGGNSGRIDVPRHIKRKPFLTFVNCFLHILLLHALLIPPHTVQARVLALDLRVQKHLLHCLELRQLGARRLTSSLSSMRRGVLIARTVL